MAKSAIEKISARAKQIRKSHPNMEWRTAINKASAEYRSGKKIGKPAKVGKSRRVGKVRKVKVVRKKSVAKTTIGSHNVPAQIAQEQHRIKAAEIGLDRLRSTSTAGMSAADKSARKKAIAYLVKARQQYKKNIVNLKRLI